jgi:nucleotide-binding universal stress UspA family protein
MAAPIIKESTMYSSIMIPVNLAKTNETAKAISVAADLAKLYSAKAYIVGVGQTAPSKTAHNPKEFSEKLNAFAAEQSEAQGVEFTPHSELSHDPAVDLDDILLRAAKTLDVDLAVMASHIPGYAEHFFASNAGYLASHASISVFVVR